MNKVNFQKRLEELLNFLKERAVRPSLLLHCCCAPCSSHVLSVLSPFFDITVLFYNPNIYPQAEHDLRLRELERLICEMGLARSVQMLHVPYRPDQFSLVARGFEHCPEGDARCTRCYRLRLDKTATLAAAHSFDYFGTTLTVSPYKNAQRLNEIGAELAADHGVQYLFSDFKKNDGYKRSIELSKKYNLYRQNYCGCEYSKRPISSSAV